MLKKIAAVVAGAGLIMTVACAKTDAGITTNVKTRLAADDTVKAYEINVDTNNGVVTLTGTVEDPTAKEMAIVIARQTAGVSDVVDQITVNRAEATSGALDRSTDLDERAADAADNIADRTADAARNTVDKTKDLAQKTGEAVTDAAITSAVKAKMLADPMVKGLKIDVDTSNGVVTLNGNVASKSEMDQAMMIARDTKGVSRVVVNLHVK